MVKKQNALTTFFLYTLLFSFVILISTLAISRIIYPFDTGIYEAVVWAPAEIAINGQNPFSFAQIEPYVMAPYGYLYYLLIGTGINFFGLQFWFARLISVIAVVGTLVCLARICKMFQSSPLSAGLFFLSQMPLLNVFATQRPDSIAQLLSVIGLTLLLEKKIIPASILFVCGLYFKQTFVLLPFFGFIWLISQKSYRKAILFALIGVGLIAVFVVLLGENYRWQHFYLTQSIPSSFWQAINVACGVLLRPTLIPLLIGILIAAKTLKHSRFRSRDVFWGSCIVGALLVAFFTSMRAGSNVNYYLETAFLVSIYIGRIRQRWFVITILLCGSVQVSSFLRGEYFRWKTLPFYQEISYEYSIRVPVSQPGISIYPDLIAASGRSYHFGDWIQYVDGRSPELTQLFQRELEKGKYKVVIWNSPLDGYHQVPLTHSNLGYPLYLFVRDEDTNNSFQTEQNSR